MAEAPAPPAIVASDEYVDSKGAPLRIGDFVTSPSSVRVAHGRVGKVMKLTTFHGIKRVAVRLDASPTELSATEFVVDATSLTRVDVAIQGAGGGNDGEAGRGAAIVGGGLDRGGAPVLNLELGVTGNRERGAAAGDGGGALAAARTAAGRGAQIPVFVATGGATGGRGVGGNGPIVQKWAKLENDVSAGHFFGGAHVRSLYSVGVVPF
jgi:hypothetical protein